jgi:diguanylate cyclase (GGDEF)-like protein/PAS domain S-box-containing protein
MHSNQHGPQLSSDLSHWVSEQCLDLLADSVLFLDDGLRVLHANQAFFDTFGLPAGDGKNETVFSLGQDDWQIPRLKALLNDILSVAEEQLDFELTHDFKTIGQRSLLINARRFRNAVDKIYVALVIKDVTAARSSEPEIYDALVRSLSDMGEGMLIIENNRFSFVNQTLCELSGYGTNELLHMASFLDLFHPDERTHIAERHNLRLAGESFTTCYETALLHKSGRRVEVDISVASLMVPQRRGVVITLRDITTRKQFELALLESEERHRTFIEKLSDGVCVTVDGRILFANESLSKITGYAADELMKLNLLDMVFAQDAEKLQQFIGAANAGEPGPQEHDVTLRRQDGASVFIRLNYSHIDWNGQSALLSTVTDITSRKRMEADLMESRDRLRCLISAAPFPLLLKRHSNNEILYINQHAANLFKLDVATANGRAAPDYDDFSPGTQQHVEAILERYGALHNYEVTYKDAEGKLMWVVMSAQALTYGGEKCVLVALYDITSRKQAEIRLEYLAHHDALTDLPNRALFFDRLTQSLHLAHRYGTMVAVLYLDLDGFKSVNDRLGHAAGDALLQKASRRLSECVRKSDTVARMGGDEFAIVLTRIEAIGQVTAVTEKILRAIQLPFDLNGTFVNTATSIGISMYPNDGDKGDLLVKHADSAMYCVKVNGKNGFALYSSLPPPVK